MTLASEYSSVFAKFLASFRLCIASRHEKTTNKATAWALQFLQQADMIAFRQPFF